MVDEERVARLLTRIRADIAMLEQVSSRLPSDLAGEVVLLDAAKYRFVTAIEGCVRVAQHLLASESWGVPETNAAAFAELLQHGVLTQENASEMASAVGFRNILVHEYAEVDDTRVVRQLAQLRDLRAFVSQVAEWLVSRRS